MGTRIERLGETARRLLWELDARQLSRWRRAGVRTIRLTHAVVRDLLTGELTLRAMSLVYTTLLGFVPLLAVSFSVLKGFGVHNQFRPLLFNFLAPLGAKGAEIAERIVSFVENVQVGVLGSLGVALLIYVVISLIQKIENSLNYTWRVTELRSFGQRFSGYMSVLLIGPVLMFSAVGFMASVRSAAVVESVVSVEPIGTLVLWLGGLVPYVLIIGAFTFVYVFIPNTRVRVRSALVGGIIAGVLWEVTALVFATFVVNSTRYTAIYSGFAILLLFMIWLYLNWLILLIGGQIAFYHQYPEAAGVRPGPTCLSAAVRERIGLLACAHVARRFYQAQAPWTLEQLAHALGLPPHLIHDVVRGLVARGVLTETGDEPPRLLPATDPAGVSLRALVEGIHAAGEGPAQHALATHSAPAVATTLERLERARADGLEGLTLKDLAGQEPGASNEE